MSAIAALLRSGTKGESVVYYTGFLLKDRKRVVVVLGLPTMIVDDPKVVVVQKEAMLAYTNRQVHLTQRKLGIGKYEYIATRR